MRDGFNIVVIFGVLLGLLWLGMVLFAPCDWIDWAPAAEVPGRCFR